MPIVLALLMLFVATPTYAQLELRKNGAVTAADYVYKESLHGFVSVGFAAAGFVEHSSSKGWIGFYPIARDVKPASVQEYRPQLQLWPQPASTDVFVRFADDKDVAGGFPTRVHAVDVYGRQTSVPIHVIGTDVVRIDVSSLAIGTYAVGLGKGIIVRIGSRP